MAPSNCVINSERHECIRAYVRMRERCINWLMRGLICMLPKDREISSPVFNRLDASCSLSFLALIKLSISSTKITLVD